MTAGQYDPNPLRHITSGLTGTLQGRLYLATYHPRRRAFGGRNPWLPELGRYASAALALVCAAAGCMHRAPPQITTVVFDGQSREISGATSCVRQPDGDLLILANGNDHGRVRVLLDRGNRLSVLKVSLHVGDWSGYSEEPAEMWATQSDGVYTINGRMPPAKGELAAHQFQITTKCPYESPASQPQPGIADRGAP